MRPVPADRKPKSHSSSVCRYQFNCYHFDAYQHQQLQQHRLRRPHRGRHRSLRSRDQPPCPPPSSVFCRFSQFLLVFSLLGYQLLIVLMAFATCGQGFQIVDMATLCINSSNTEMSEAEGSILLSLPLAAADKIEDVTRLVSRPVCSFTLTSQSPADRLILVLPNVTDSPDTTCTERSNHDRVELRLLNGPITNEVNPSEPYWNLCTSATTSSSSSSSLTRGNWTNQTVLTEESLSFQRIFVTFGPSVDVFLDFSSAIDSIMGYSMDEFDGRDSISIYYKSFSSNAQLEDDLCIQCDSNDSWAWEAEICSDVYLNCSYPLYPPSNETHDNKVIINCIPEEKPRSELFSIMMAGAIVLTIIFVSFHCSPGGSTPARRPAAMDIMLRDDISRRGGGGLGGGRGPFGNTSYKVQAPSMGKGPVSHV